MRVSTYSFSGRAVADMNRAQQSINRLQTEISGGKKLLTPSDNPAQVASTENLDAAIIRLDQYTKNSSLAGQRLNQQESVLDNLTDTLQRIKELSIAANSGTGNTRDRDAYRLEITELKDQVLDYANSRTPDGAYLFSGSRTQRQPFTLTESGAEYHGDQTQNYIRISDSRKVLANDTGDTLFTDIGNGGFTITAANTNTGTGVIQSSAVTDPAATSSDRFSIKFTSDQQFDVINNDSGNTVLSAQSFVSGGSIEFNGLSMSIEGTPQSGDIFTTTPNTHRDIFSTLQNFANVMQSDPATPSEQAKFTQTMNTVMGDLDLALDHIQSRRSNVGARLAYIDNTRAENDSVDYLLKKTRSDIEDTDYADAISNLQMQMNTLEAIRKTYMQVQSSTLFNYLR